MAKKRAPRPKKVEEMEPSEGSENPALASSTAPEEGDDVVLPTTLSELITDADVQRILLYGPPKIGKSTLASKFPKALILDADDGYHWLRVKKVRVTKWEHVLSVGYQLADAEENKRDLGFRTVVFDTSETLYKLCFKYVCDKHDVDHPSELKFGQGWQLIAAEYAAVVRAFNSLGLGVIFVSNSEYKTVTDRFGKDITVEQPQLPKQAEQAITPLCDLLLKVEVDRTVKDEDGEYTARALLPQSNPFMTTGGRMSHLLPRKINASYQDLHKALQEAAVRIRKESK